ncbi:MAG: hypothetical protein EOP07_18715 [Proteobacteria bacterium]|nr:MAG: hypothetical protein EOP07_18715 [Pseudomonadota bacterium]
MVRNRNRRALTQAEYNQVGFYPLIQGYTEFLDGMRSTSFWRVMESTMTEEEILQLEPERLLEHVFAVTVKNRKSDSEAFRRSLTKGKYDDSVYSRLRQSCLDVAGLIGDVEIPSGTGRNAREYQIAARKILLNGSAMLARARINGGGRNWQEPMKKIVATVLDATVAPNVRKEHLKSTWKSFNGVPSGGGKHQKDLRVIFQKAVQGGK